MLKLKVGYCVLWWRTANVFAVKQELSLTYSRTVASNTAEAVKPNLQITANIFLKPVTVETTNWHQGGSIQL